MSSPVQLQDGEHIVLLIRKHWLVLLSHIAGSVIAWVLPFIVYAYCLQTGFIPPGLRATHIFVFGAAWWTLVVWLALSIIVTNHYLDLWIVTNRRVINIVQNGLFDRVVSAWGIERVQEATVHMRTFIQTFFNYGTLEILTAGPEGGHTKVSGIPNPAKVSEIIMQSGSRIAELEKANQGQEELLHTISHEVKGYLTKDVAALATIAEGDAGDVSPSVRSIAERALGETRKGVSAVMDLLQDTDTARGTMRLSETTFDMRPVLQSLLSEYEAAVQKKGLALDAHLTTDACMVRGDQIKLRDLVFRNILENAMHYTPSGSIRVELAKMNGIIICTVTDTGVGITPEDMPRLFSPGGHGKESKRVNPDSTGFGLFSAKQMIEAQGGKIMVRSDGKGKGSSFIIGLPEAQ